MAKGDAADMARRMRAMLPDRWFPDAAPVLAALLQGLGSVSASVFALLGQTQQQARLLTVSGGFLDMAGADFRGAAFLRRPSESDAAFRSRLLPIFRDKVTRAALIARLTEITGHVPRVFEPTRPADTGAYNSPTLAYGAAGGYGSLGTPFTVFVDVDRPVGAGIPNVSGYNGTLGGYGVGAIEYASLDMEAPHVTDQDIYDAITDVMPLGCTCWVRLGGMSYDYVVDPALIGTAPLDDFNLDLGTLA